MKSCAFKGTIIIGCLASGAKSKSVVEVVLKQAGYWTSTRVIGGSHSVGAYVGSVVGPDVGEVVGGKVG